MVTARRSVNRYSRPMLAEWIRSALSYAQMSQVELAAHLTRELGRNIDKAAVNKMALVKPTGKTKPRQIQADEMMAIARITKFPLPQQMADEEIGDREDGAPREALNETGEGFHADEAPRREMPQPPRRARPTAWQLLSMEDMEDLRRIPEGKEFDPDPDPDHEPTVGSETGRIGVPEGAIVQLDVTAGMGGGGMTIVNPGVPGKHGMTFSAENIRDYWRVPSEVLASLGLHHHDVVVMPVQGDSMEPTLIEDEYVFVDTRHRLPSPDGLYALTDEFGGIIVKRLEVIGRRDDDMLVKVISDNPKHEPKQRLLSEICVIGRIVRRFGIVR